MVNIQFKVDSKGAVKEIKALGKTIKTSEKEATKWAKAGFFASAGASAYKLSVNLLRKALTSLIGPIKDSVFEMGVLGDRIAKDARMIGVTAEQFQVMEFAAKRSGTSVTAVNNGMKKLGRVMVDARNGSRQIKDTFNALGIELMKSNGTLRDTFDVFLELADKSMVLGESAERTGVQMLLLGRSGTELSNMLSQGRDGVLDLEADLKRLGAVMGEDALDNSELFVDRMADLEHAFRGVKIRLGEELMPSFTAFASDLATFLANLDVGPIRRLAEAMGDASQGFLLAGQRLGLLPALSRDVGESFNETSRDADDLINRLDEGAITISDLALAMNNLGVDSNIALSRLSEQTFLPLQQGAAASAAAIYHLLMPIRLLLLAYEKMTGVHFDLKGSVQETTDAFFSMAGSFESAQFAGTGSSEEFQRKLRLLKLRIEDITDAQDRMAEAFDVADLTGASEEETALLKQYVLVTQQRMDADAETLRLGKERIRQQEEEAKAEKERLRLIEEGRLALRRRIANLEALRKKKEDDAEATNKQAKALKELLEIEEYYNSIQDRFLKSQEDIYKEFFEIDRGDTSESFMQGLMDEQSFRRQMALGAEQELRTEWAQRNAIIMEGLNTGRVQYANNEEALTKLFEDTYNLRQQNDAMYAAGKIEMENETNSVVLENQNQQMSAMQDVINSSGQMFGALSDIAMDAYRKGDQEALSHARALFAVQQAMALAGATVSTAQAITNALATPPAPLGIALAVGAGIAGAAQIATIIGTSIQGIGDAGLTSDTLRKAGLNNHSAIAVRNDETILDPVGTRHITEMLEIQKAQMVGSSSEQKISTTVEIDGRVLGESVDSYMIRQQERGLAYSNRVRQDYL
jgi:hypothetical protein|tara:strand:- start:3465 stop:6059 length:2595 start_codon:yes stop_codon:yes gene_type:complete